MDRKVTNHEAIDRLVPSWARQEDRGHIMVVGAAPDAANTDAVYLRRITPFIFMEPQWDIACGPASLYLAACGGVTCAVASRRGFHYMARLGVDRSLRITRLRHGSFIEEPVSAAVRALPDDCLLADMAISTTGAVWLLVVRMKEPVAPDNEWLLLNATSGTTIEVTRGPGAVHAAPTVDAHPWEDTLLVSVPSGEDIVAHSVFLVDPVRRAVVRRPSPECAYTPCWSPCGRFVAYCTSARERSQGGPGSRGPSEVWVAERDFANPVLVAEDEWVFDLSWTADGGHLVLLDGGAPRANKGRGGILRAVDVASGLGACDLFRPEDGAEGRCLFLHVDALDFRLERKTGGPAARVPPASTASLPLSRLAEAIGSCIEAAIRHCEVLARVHKGLPQELLDALDAWAQGQGSFASSFVSATSVPLVARLLAATERPADPGAADTLARKAFELLVWRYEVACGLRVGLADDEVPEALQTVGTAAGVLLARAARAAEAAGRSRAARNLSLLAAQLADTGANTPSGAKPPLWGLVSGPGVRDRLDARMPQEAWTRVQSPYVALSELSGEARQLLSESEDPKQACRTAVLLDTALANATLKREGARGLPMALSARLWWWLGGLRRLALALARIAQEWEGPTEEDDAVAVLADKCGDFLPDSERVALACLLLMLESLSPTLLFRAFRVAFRIIAVGWRNLTREQVQLAAEVAVGTQRLLAARFADTREAVAATEAIGVMEQDGVLAVVEARPEEGNPLLGTVWQALGKSLQVTVAGIVSYCDSILCDTSVPSKSETALPEDHGTEVTAEWTSQEAPAGPPPEQAVSGLAESSPVPGPAEVKTSGEPGIPVGHPVPAEPRPPAEPEGPKGQSAMDVAPGPSKVFVEVDWPDEPGPRRWPRILLGIGIAILAMALLWWVLHTPSQGPPPRSEATLGQATALSPQEPPSPEVLSDVFETREAQAVSDVPAAEGPMAVAHQAVSGPRGCEPLPLEPALDHESRGSMLPDPGATALWRECRREFERMRFEVARRRCEEAIEADPHFNGARCTLGWVMLEQGEIDSAEALAREVLKRCIAPRVCRGAQVLAAAVSTVQGDYEPAISMLKEAIRLGDQGEALARYKVLCMGEVSLDWARDLLPRYACWSRKGQAAAQSFLARRGILDPKVFEEALGQLDEAERKRLWARGLRVCPW